MQTDLVPEILRAAGTESRLFEEMQIRAVEDVAHLDERLYVPKASATALYEGASGANRRRAPKEKFTGEAPAPLANSARVITAEKFAPNFAPKESKMNVFSRTM